MAGAWCTTCCSPSVLPAVAICKRVVKSSSSSACLSSALRRQSFLGAQSSSRRSEVVRCCCASTSRSESSCSDSGSHFVTRRQALLLVSGAAAVVVASPSYADEEISSSAVDTTITDRVYLDLMECPSLARSDRTLGNTSLICSDGEDLGRIVIGLYGKQVPQTVKNFKAMCTGAAGSSYEGTIFNRVLQGQYIQAGRQGPRDKGETSPPTKLDRNEEVVRGNSFKLRHQRPGTVSLCLSENDDEEAIKLNTDYRNVEFMITTGPGPASQLDNGNIVFGTVLEGMEVVAAISTVPTYKPSGRIQQFNSFAQLLGDDRAASARANWDKPLKSVVIKRCGVLNVARPGLATSLP
ncbi:hypothetical protein KC19_2G073900 [Ceratodon purpureus]|uniref:PPIase cyclophilin-type domain-containing protein n=1 Tax=Ceratodon purpureus TaxID=3225 RepID=A0A8T0IU77_CERPU|nr:hypothetical protein KC19_2G073900 [Ceratodon purpureus]